VSEKSTRKALDEAAEARTAANRTAFLPQTLAFSGQTFFWPRNLPQERYNSMELVPKKGDSGQNTFEMGISLKHNYDPA
jgi:hypothetical protein